MRCVILIALLLAACAEDKEPTDFGDLDTDLGVAADSRVDEGTGDVAAEDEVPTECVGHDDCLEDELCFESECTDREEALADCDENDDCPDGFVCIDEDRCEEE